MVVNKRFTKCFKRSALHFQLFIIICRFCDLMAINNEVSHNVVGIIPFNQNNTDSELGYDMNINNFLSENNNYTSNFKDFNLQSIVRYEKSQLWGFSDNDSRYRYITDILQKFFGGSIWKRRGGEIHMFLQKPATDIARKIFNNFSMNYTIMIDDVQELIDQQTPHEKEEFRYLKTIRMSWNKYHRFRVIRSFMEDLSKTYPNLCKLYTIGYSIENRPLQVLRIGNGENGRHNIWIDGGIHAREWISPAAVTFIMHKFVVKWNQQPQYVRNKNWYFMPMMNPDGYEYSHTVDRMWRKNRRPFGKCVGVDLNRNYGFQWAVVGSGNSPCDTTYHGQKPFSEPESRAMSEFLKRLSPSPQVYLTYHSYGQYLLYPWGYKVGVAGNHKDLLRAGKLAASNVRKLTGRTYITEPAYQISGPAAGGSDDWAKAVLGSKYVYTVELPDKGNHGFLLPPKFIKGASREALSIAYTISNQISG